MFLRPLVLILVSIFEELGALFPFLALVCQRDCVDLTENNERMMLDHLLAVKDPYTQLLLIQLSEVSREHSLVF